MYLHTFIYVYMCIYTHMYLQHKRIEPRITNATHIRIKCIITKTYLCTQIYPHQHIRTIRTKWPLSANKMSTHKNKHIHTN